MAFTAGELTNIANATLDFYLKGKPQAQTIQDKPLLKAMEKAKKTFPGGKGYIDGPVKGNYETYFSGFTHDDTVAYTNPANIKRVKYDWKEIHGGLGLTMTELKHDGISVVDTDGKSTKKHSDREKTALVNLLEDKMEDMTEGMSRDKNDYYWGDGVADAKGPAGIKAILTDTPLTGTTGGADRAALAWWRHRAFVGAGTNANGAAITNTVDLPLFLKSEFRQLRRFGGKPNLILAGSAFIEQLEKELYAKGQFTQTGFASNGRTDIGIADLSFNGISIKYDPTLDDLSEDKRMYVVDTRRLFPYVMEGEDMKTHNPKRPAEKYVIYRGVTWTGNLFCNQLNCHGVYEIA